MTNREMLMELKKAKLLFDYLADIADEIVTSTFDGNCYSVDDLIVGDKTIEVVYKFHYCGEFGHESVFIPIEWFDEGFGYEAAYEEMKLKKYKKNRRR